MSRVEGSNHIRPKSRHEFGSRMSVLLSNPDYLLEGFAEKKCQFIGIIEDVPTSSDMSDRGYLLSTLDSKRNVGKLPWTLGIEHNVTITVSAYNMKIIKDDRGGAIIHRIPIHEIASASYINDDNHHLLFVKAGNASHASCPCYIFTFSKQADAEEVCSILQQAFQLVYTEATMEHLNESITAGERGVRTSRSSVMLLPRSRGVSPPKPQSPVHSLPKPRSPVHHGASPPTPAGATPPSFGGMPSTTGPSVPTLPEDTEETIEESVSAVELVQEYMERLHKLMNFKELREFATLLKRYREDLKVNDFLEKLKDLYGKQRQFLIPDMNSFIPEEDMPAFEKFLSDHNLLSNLSSMQAAGEMPTAATLPTADQKGRGLHQGMIDVDHLLMDLNKENDPLLTTNF